MPRQTDQLGSQSYRLAIDDRDFLLRSEMRATRFQLEFAKADLMLRDWGVRSTIIVFGSARTASPEIANTLESALADDDHAGRDRLRRQVGYYEAARAFARLASEQGGSLLPDRENVVCTGGGPGIMEAANRGAFDAGAPNIGFNITLPQEQLPNPYSTPALTFQFHYFAIRKMHLAMRAKALVVFPGGFGTLDEMFEILTLQQTNKAPRAPVLLFGSDYWRRIVDFDLLLEEGYISPEDLSLFSFADTPEEAWRQLLDKGLTTLRGPRGLPPQLAAGAGT